MVTFGKWHRKEVKLSMNNFKAKKIFRKLGKGVFLLGIVIAMLTMMVVLRLYVVSKKDCYNPQFTNGNLEVHMLDVGQGDSFVLLQNDKVMLIDAGTMYNLDVTNKALKELGVKKIDYVILTHYHQDHAAGLFTVLLDYKVDCVFVTDMTTYKQFRVDVPYYLISSMLKLVDAFSVEDVIQLVKDEEGKFKSFQFEDSYVEFLAPIDDEYEIINNYSLVAKVTYGDVKILFTGDIEKEAEKQLLEAGVDLSATVYKAAHHGSMTSNSKEFIEAVNPEVVLISSDNGNHNLYGHPVKSFMEYLEENKTRVYRTDESGTVKLTVDGVNVFSNTSRDDYKSGEEIVNMAN